MRSTDEEVGTAEPTYNFGCGREEREDSWLLLNHGLDNGKQLFIELMEVDVDGLIQQLDARDLYVSSIWT